MSPHVGRGNPLCYLRILAVMLLTATASRIDSKELHLNQVEKTVGTGVMRSKDEIFHEEDQEIAGLEEQMESFGTWNDIDQEEDNVEDEVDWQEEDPENNDVVLQFDGAYYKKNQDANMKITRQGEVLYQGKATTYPFKMSQLYKEYVVTFEDPKAPESKCRQPIYVKSEHVPGQCGINLFTAKERTCNKVDSKDVELEYQRVQRFEPPSNRGFGIEFEFVAREPSKSQYNELVANLRENFDENVTQQMLNSEEGGVHGVHLCFNKVANRFAKSDKGAPPKQSCDQNHDCALSEYCLDCRKCLEGRKSSSMCGLCESEDTSICHPAVDCNDRALPTSGECPYPLMKWNWEVDKSVIPLTEEEQREIGAPHDETLGTSFEVTAPGPPYVLGGPRGLHSTVAMMTALKHIGLQAGPSSGIHLHVNVMNPDAPGTLLTFAEIATVWAAYAKYQLVIDEMFTPNRVPNHYANALFLGDCEEKSDKGKCSTDPCGCNKRIFHQMHDWVRKNRTGSKTQFCNAVVTMPGARKSCTWRHPHQRYTQLNLIPLHRFGTIEFRAHSTTHDIERVARWIQFCITFVDYFSKGPGHKQMIKFFESDWLKDYKGLAKAQRAATVENLFTHMEKGMGSNVDKGLAMQDNKEFFARRKFEQNDPACIPEFGGKRGSPPVIAGSCTAVTPTKFVPAVLVVDKDGQQTMKVQLPPFVPTQNTHNFDVEMPSGQMWKVKVYIEDNAPVKAELPNKRIYDLIKIGGTYEFTFVTSTGDQMEQAQIFQLTDHRCCCDKLGTCKWFPPEMLGAGTCPYLHDKKDKTQCATTSSMKCITKWFGTCQKLSHSRRREKPKHKCAITNDKEAFFTGKKCSDKS